MGACEKKRPLGGRVGPPAIPDDQTKPLSILQTVTRGHPPDGDVVCSVSLSPRKAEHLPRERGIDVSHGTIGFCWNRFGPMFAKEIRRKRVDGMRACLNWRRHLDEIFVKIDG